MITYKHVLVHNGHIQHNHKLNISITIQMNNIPDIDCPEEFQVFERIDILDSLIKNHVRFSLY